MTDANDPPERFAKLHKMDADEYERANEFIREHLTFTASEWAIARLCADFRTETGVEMTTVGENVPDLVPFIHEEYSRQQVYQHRERFEEKVRKAGATFLYGAMCDFFTSEELDEIMYEATEVAKYALELEGANLGVETEIEAEERVGEVMREVRDASRELRDDASE